MNPMPLRKRKNSLRHPGYDYTTNGAYFVTICTHHRLNYFGAIEQQEMILSPLGKIVEERWLSLPTHHPTVELDVFVVMPNHFHGIVILQTGMTGHAPTRQFSRPISNSISTIVGSFKASVTRTIKRLPNAPEFPIWQRNYHDHIIRNHREYETIATYVEHNPALWEQDRFFG